VDPGGDRICKGFWFIFSIRSVNSTQFVKYSNWVWALYQTRLEVTAFFVFWRKQCR